MFKRVIDRLEHCLARTARPRFNSGAGKKGGPFRRVVMLNGGHVSTLKGCLEPVGGPSGRVGIYEGYL